MNPGRIIEILYTRVRFAPKKYSMNLALAHGTTLDRRVAIRLNEQSLMPRVARALTSLGYLLNESGPADAEGDEPAIETWLVDRERLHEVPPASDVSGARIIVVGPPQQAEPEDPRIVAEISRPGRLGSIYAALQCHIERYPRRVPRVETQLSARCIRADRRAIGAVLSLSEGGCLLRTTENLRKGNRINLQFALPHYGLVSTRAECRYKRKGNAGMAFADPGGELRETLAHYVTFQLAEAP